jgi:arsenite oxidase small subunit
MNEPSKHVRPTPDWASCISRRQFLFLGAASLTVIALDRLVSGQTVYAELARYEDRRIGSLSQLMAGSPVLFRFPWDHPGCDSYLVKLGVPAGGGVGPENDVVAFNIICPHMGYPLEGTYKPGHQALGPCGQHLSTFDLTRHGMVIAGHSTQSLPQITLDVRGDEIYATGVMGLLYGFSDNAVGPGA